MLAQFGQTFNRKEIVRELIGKCYAAAELEEEIRDLEMSSCGDTEMMRGIYEKLDEVNQVIKYYRSLLN